jgi:hypothetical protein
VLFYSEKTPLKLYDFREVATMWKCANCGEQIEDKYEICWNCGIRKLNDSTIEGAKETERGEASSLTSTERFRESSLKNERRFIMNKEEIIWLAIKGLGLYFVVAAFIGLPDLLMAVSTTYAYSNVISSLSSSADANKKATTVAHSRAEGDEMDAMLEQLRSTTAQREASLMQVGNSAMSVYRSLLVGPLARFILFSAIGIYLLKRGDFLFRLLNRQPSTDG